MMAGVQNRKIQRVISLLLVTLYFYGLPAQAQYGGGTGEPNDPYQIATADDLMLLGESPEDCDKHFILTADIDLDPNLPRRKVFDRAVIPWFGGTFDGNNLTISHLTIEGGGYLGLFGRLSSGAEVKDLGVVDVNITSSGDQVGGLVGDNEGYVTHCYSTGAVTGVNYVGGLVGSNGALSFLSVPGQYFPDFPDFPVSLWSTIYNCYSTVYVTGNTGVGGLLGSNSGDVTQCYSNAVVIGNSSVGGLAGANRGAGTIARCYAICTIRKAFPQWQADESIGGLVGTNFGTPGSSWDTWYPSIPARVAVISDCYSIVSGDSQVSGLLVGQNGDSNSKPWFSISPGRIVNCYAACDSSGTVEASGLVGRNYWGGWVLGCFWDAQACGIADNAEGGTPKTTAEMQMAGTFLDVDWGGCVDEVIWTIDEGNDYPRLWWEDKPGQPLQARLSELLEGDGTEESPYTIYTLEDIYTIARFPCEHDKHFRLGFLSGEGKQENPYLIYTTDELDLLSLCPYEQDAYFRLGFVTGEGTQESPYLIYTANEINLLNMCPYERDAYFKLGFIAGEGTQESPYLIYTVDELNLLSICPYELDKHFKLMADIDLAGITYSKAVIPKFAGMFDGNNRTISNLTVDGYRNLGLFGQLETGAEVRNLGIVDVNITGSRYVGGLAGMNNGSITASYSTGSVTGEIYTVGGLVGNNEGLINTSFSTGTVTGDGEVGGLVGCNNDRIFTSYSTGAVTGETEVGGLVGKNYEGIITTSYSTGAVTGNNLVGGLVGYDWGGLVTASFWDIETCGLTVSAGGAGLSTAKMMDAEILGSNGLGVDPNWVLDNGRDYPRLVWEGTPGQMIPELVIDWLDGSGTVEDPYQIETANQLLMLHDYSLLWGKHFVMNADIDLNPNRTGQNLFEQAVIPTFWGSFAGNGHVILNLRIEGEERLGLFGKLLEGSVVRDLGLESISVKSSGYNVGALAGNNRGFVTNCYSTGSVSGKSRVGGLLGVNYGVVTACYSIGTVTGDKYVYVGGLLGINYGVVTRCYSSSAVSGGDQVGGLVGRTSRVSSVIQCYSTGSVTGVNYVGGLLGSNNGVVTSCYSISTVTGDKYVGGLVGHNSGGSVFNCYSTGAVRGEDSVGGLIGYNAGNVLNCYSACSVFGTERVGGLVGDNPDVLRGMLTLGYVTYCFWDTWISGQNWSGGGIGKTTAEMQTSVTFLDAGWDFVDETENGTEDIWWILEGQDYPRLWWEEVSELEN